MTTERLILVARRTPHWAPDYKPHDGELDAVIATMTERAKEGKAGSLGYEVLQVEVVRRVHIEPRITAVDVTTPEGENA